MNNKEQQLHFKWFFMMCNQQNKPALSVSICLSSLYNWIYTSLQMYRHASVCVATTQFKSCQPQDKCYFPKDLKVFNDRSKLIFIQW